MVKGPAVEGGNPAEDLDGGWNRNAEGQEGEDHTRELRLTGDEHVMSPDDEGDDGDGHGGHRNRAVAEDVLAAVYGDDLRHDAEARQDHDVDRGVAVEPEEVLVQHRVSTHRRIEDADLQRVLDHQQ
jgi:hypothetical protein